MTHPAASTIVPGSAIALAALLAACTATAPEPRAPTATPVASAAAPSLPASSPPASPSPIPSVTPPPRLPSPTPGAPEPSDAPVDPGPTGELYALDCSGDVCRDEFLPEPTTDQPGWPVIVSGPCRGMAKGTDGVAFAACDGDGVALIHAFDTAANRVPGWPVRLPGATASTAENLFEIGCGDGASSLAIGADGTILVAVAGATTADLYALASDGSIRAGWPRPFPGDAPGVDGWGGNGCRGFALAPDQSVLAWGYQGVVDDIELVAERTEFTVYERDGRTRAGWPRGSIGAASRPLVAGDGSVIYVSASGNIWRHEANGEIAAGWPYQLPTKAPPYLSPDGRIVVLTDRAISLAFDGHVVSGWPVQVGERETQCLFGDTPCLGTIAPTFGPDGTLYVSLADGSVTAIDASGGLVPGWPVDLGDDTHAVGLAVDPAGRLAAHSVVCGQDGCGGVDTRAVTLVFAPDGSLLERREP